MNQELIRQCKKCGASERYKSGACKHCADLASKSYALKNAAAIKIKKAAYNAKNYEKFQVAHKKWRESNRDKDRAYSSAWAKANPEKRAAAEKARSKRNPTVLRSYSQNRRARKNNAGGKLSKDLVEKLFKLQKGRCACCKKLLGNNYHIDHIIPLARGGHNMDFNIQLLRGLCNKQKSAKDPIDFMRSRGFLL